MAVDDRFFIDAVEFAEMEPLYTDFDDLRTGVDVGPTDDLFTSEPSVIEAWEAIAPVPHADIPDEAYGFACMTSVVMDIAGLDWTGTGIEPEPADGTSFAGWDIDWVPNGQRRWVPGGRLGQLVYQLSGTAPFGTFPISALGSSVNEEYIVQDKVAGSGRLFSREPIPVPFEVYVGEAGTTDFGYGDPSWTELYARPFHGTNPGFFGFGRYLHHRGMGRPAPHPFEPHVSVPGYDGRSHYDDGGAYGREAMQSGHVWPSRVKWRRYVWHKQSGVDVSFADFRLITIPYRLVNNKTRSTVAAALDSTGTRKHIRRVTSGR